MLRPRTADTPERGHPGAVAAAHRRASAHRSDVHDPGGSAAVVVNWKKWPAAHFRTVASLPAAKGATFAACPAQVDRLLKPRRVGARLDCINVYARGW